MNDQTETKNRVVKGCAYSAGTALTIIIMVIMTACVINYFMPRKYEGRVVYSGGETIARPQTYRQLADDLGLGSRWQLPQDEVVAEIGRSFTFGALAEEREQLVVLRKNKDEAAELANAWAETAGVEVIRSASPNLLPAYPSLRKTFAIGLLAGIALALPPAAIVLLLSARAK